GPIDVVLVPAWFSNVEQIWGIPPARRFLERLATFSRLILSDKRGTGLSDPIDPGAIVVEQFGDDLLAVLDDVGSAHAALIGCDAGAVVTMLAAATRPQRTSSLVLINAFARLGWAPDYPAGVPQRLLDEWLGATLDQWSGRRSGLELLAPSASPDLEEPLVRFLRSAVSPRIAVATRRTIYGLDVRSALPAIQAPTLVIHRSGNRFVRVDHGRYLAAHITGSRLV